LRKSINLLKGFNESELGTTPPLGGKPFEKTLLCCSVNHVLSQLGWHLQWNVRLHLDKLPIVYPEELFV